MNRLFLVRMVCASLLAFALSAFAASDDVDLSKLPVIFDDVKHSMYFRDTGWFSTTEYPLRYFNGYWRWQTSDGKWLPLVTPYVTKWNDKYRLILNTGGRIFVIKNDNSSNFEVRLINGEWCDNAGGEWAPLLDLYIYSQ